ncbi:MAG: nicotinamidase [Paludibacteraceae bacterium]
MKKALLIVDVQNDFIAGGTLAVKDGDKVVPVINRIMNKFNLILASRDWHPENSVHFEKWPVHCVRNTFGAELHPDLQKNYVDQFLLKGTEDKDDGYSAFEATNISLTDYLKSNEVTDLYVTGLATDYCVKATALDAVKNGFKTYVVTDAVAAVNINPDDDRKALQEMQQQGITLIKSTDIE